MSSYDEAAFKKAKKEERARDARAINAALERYKNRGARDARIERGAHGYMPQERVVTVEVYQTGSLTRTRIVAGSVEQLEKLAEKI